MKNLLVTVRNAAFGFGIGAGIGVVAWAAGVAYAARSYATMSEREKQDIIDSYENSDEHIADLIERMKSLES